VGQLNPIAGDLAGELVKLKRQSGKNVLISGSPVLVRSFLRDGLLDELSLNILPLIGAPACTSSTKMTIRCVSSLGCPRRSAMACCP
jgi:hypothetical protein